MTDNPAENVPAHSAFKVLAALAELGEATAAAVAEHAALGYSTTTPKLRAWEGSGQAERFRTGDGITLWRLTDAGRAATAPHPAPAPDTPDPIADPEAADAQSQTGESSPATTAADDPTPATGEHEQPAASDGSAASEATTTAPADGIGGTPAEPKPETETETDGPDTAGPAQNGTRQAKPRRADGSLRGAILDILEAHPDRQYKTGELCRLVDAANDESGAAKASAGAVANAVIKLVAAGTVVQTVERPATFQLAPSSGGE